MKKIILLIVIWVPLIFILREFVKLYSADVYFEKSMNGSRKVSVNVPIVYSGIAIKDNPLEPNYYRAHARALLTGMVYEDSDLREEMKKQILNDLQIALSLNPNNLVTARNLIPYYYLLITADGIGANPAYVKIARDYFEFLKNKYPSDAGVIALVAKYEKKIGAVQDYTNSVEIVKKLRPDLLEWHDSFR